jgi:hypothetical protein
LTLLKTCQKKEQVGEIIKVLINRIDLGKFKDFWQMEISAAALVSPLQFLILLGKDMGYR